MIISTNGKGGTGKTTVAALIVNHLASKPSGKVLALDADPNCTLANALGMRLDTTMVGVIEEASQKMANLPAGMTKDRFIEMRVQESIVEGDKFDLLAMGRPEGPGCYCYVNTVLRNVLGKVIKSYDFIVIDNAAGMEHISRRTERAIDKLVLVSDYSAIGIRSSKRIYDLAKEIGIKVKEAFLIINKVAGPLDSLKAEVAASGIPLAGALDYDNELVELSIKDAPVAELKGRKIAAMFGELMKTIMGR